MPFEWSDYAQLAEHLWNDDRFSPEARHRASASRFYYAAHWRVRTLLETKGSSFRSESIHKEVVDACLGSRVVAIRVIGEHMKRLRQKRTHADYDASTGFRDTDLGVARNAYRNIDSALRGLSAGPVRTGPA